MTTIFLLLFFFLFFFVLFVETYGREDGWPCSIFVPIINLVNVITRPNIEVPSSFQYVQPFFFSGAIYRDLTPELALGKDEIC